MVKTGKREWLLRWRCGELPHQTALCRIEADRDVLPENRLRFDPLTARAAAALSMSAEDEKLLRDDLTALGYSDILTVAYSHSDRDRIGMCIGSRVRDDLLQIAVVLRGTTDDEWYSNFDIGYSAEHTGFSRAADYAELRISDYIFTRAIGMEPDFFITGYSRGGAVAGILAKRLCDRHGLERVCAYTFASPAVTISRLGRRYSCVYNLVRDEDFFTRLPLRSWGYTRYGRDISLSGASDISARFKQLTGRDYIGFTGSAPVDCILCALQKLAPNVHAYYKRRRQVGERGLSLYEFMLSVADMLSGNMDEAAADVFVSAMISDYADLISFLSSGSDLSDIIASASAIPRCSVADSHSPAAYMAALDAFTQKLPELAHPRLG